MFENFEKKMVGNSNLLLSEIFSSVHCDISPPTAWTWNESRSDEKNQWSKETFDALVMRYEAPIGTNRSRSFYNFGTKCKKI